MHGGGGRRENLGIAVDGRLPTLMMVQVGCWRTRKSHDITRVSQACEVSSKPPTPASLFFFSSRLTIHNSLRNRQELPIGSSPSAEYKTPPSRKTGVSPTSLNNSPGFDTLRHQKMHSGVTLKIVISREKGRKKRNLPSLLPQTP